MHPILKNIRSTVEHATPAMPERADHPTNATNSMTACGIATKHEEADILRYKQKDDRLPGAKVPVVDVFRDKTNHYMDGERHLRYHAANDIVIDADRKLDVDDFRPDFLGSNEAQRHMQAAEIKRNGNYTQDLEQWAFDNFVEHARQLIIRPHTSLGLLYLSDFIDTFLDHNPTHDLVSQMILLQNHTREPTLRRAFSKITEKDRQGRYIYQWLLDLITVLDMIFRDEHTDRERLTAILTAINHIALHFAKKASGGHYPSADKLAKTHTYFKRLVLAILALAETIGSYTRNPSAVRPIKRAHALDENDDESYMFSLKGALECPEEEEEETWLQSTPQQKQHS